MPKPKVYREYFPSCIERFFGGGKPRRIKARCFVPYTEAEENTEVFLGPTPGAPNIDLDMMVCKEPKKTESAEIGFESDGCCSRRMDCGCQCRCSNTSSSFSSSSTYSPTSTSSRTKGRPKILVLEDDGRYKEVSEEFIGVHRPPRKNQVRIQTPSVKSAKLVLRGTKTDTVSHVMPPSQYSTPPSSEVFSWDDGAVSEAPPKKGVVLGYVMYDPESENQKLYVTTTEGKIITTGSNEHS